MRVYMRILCIQKNICTFAAVFVGPLCKGSRIEFSLDQSNRLLTL